MSDTASKKKIPIGPAGTRVIANVARLRRKLGLGYKDLSERLSDLGRPIPVLGLSRLEKGERRVDVDDLVALALALGVTPNALLMPAPDVPGVADTYMLTAKGSSCGAAEMMAWAAGEKPLGHQRMADRAADLASQNPSEWTSAPAAIARVLLTAYAAGLTTGQVQALHEDTRALRREVGEFHGELREAIAEAREARKQLDGL